MELHLHSENFSGGVYRRELACSEFFLGARAQTTLLGIQLDFDVATCMIYFLKKMGFMDLPIA